MPDATFFARFGLYIRPAFLGPAACAALRAAAGEAEQSPATVFTGDRTDETHTVDQNVRRTKWCDVPEEALAEVQSRLLDILPEIGAHYDLVLCHLQRLQVLRYGPGDFFRPHSDSNHAPNASRVASERQISAVIFLNGERAPGSSAGGYTGGALTFYDLLPATPKGHVGLPLEGTEGLLVTFPSEQLHGVAPVVEGARYTIVSWFT